MTRTRISQTDVTSFYDTLVFPSRASNPRYRALLRPYLHDQKMIADFGCGYSLFQETLRGHLPPPTFLDISFRSLSLINYGFRINGDLSRLPIKDGAFHVITAIGVLHHLPDMQTALGEMSRALKEAGTLILGVYAAKSIQSRLRNWYDRCRGKYVKKSIFELTQRLVSLRNFQNRDRMSREEARKRARDILETPLVRYLPEENYIQMAQDYQLRCIATDRISSMAILKLRKGPSEHLSV